VATIGTAVVLLVLGVSLLAAPGSTPGLTIPTHGSMSPMTHMGQPGPMAPPGQMKQPGQMEKPRKIGQTGS